MLHIYLKVCFPMTLCDTLIYHYLYCKKWYFFSLFHYASNINIIIVFIIIFIIFIYKYINIQLIS